MEHQRRFLLMNSWCWGTGEPDSRLILLITGAASLSSASGLLLHWRCCSWRLQRLILSQDHGYCCRYQLCWCLRGSLLTIHTNKWTKIQEDAMSWMMPCMFFSDERTSHLSQYDTERPTHHVLLVSFNIGVLFKLIFRIDLLLEWVIRGHFRKKLELLRLLRVWLCGRIQDHCWYE